MTTKPATATTLINTQSKNNKNGLTFEFQKEDLITIANVIMESYTIWEMTPYFNTSLTYSHLDISWVHRDF